MRDGCKYVEGTPNAKRRAAKKKRGFGMGQLKITESHGENKHVLDAWCQGRDPLFKVKGKQRHARVIEKIIYD